jgi:hypothetical protein
MTEPDIQRQGGSRMLRAHERIQRRIDDFQQKAQEGSHALVGSPMSKMDEEAKYLVGHGPDRLQGAPATVKALDFIMEHDLGFADGSIVAAVVRWRTAGQNLSDLLEARQILTKLIDRESYGAANRSQP